MAVGVWIVFIFIGLVKSQQLSVATSKGPGELPHCDLSVITPCMNGAVTSYIRNTKGEEAARLPPDLQTMQAVAQAINTNIDDPRTDLNRSCQILKMVDLGEMGQCLIDSSKDCTMQVTKEDRGTLFEDVLPSMQSIGFLDAVDATKKVCSPGCLLGNIRMQISDMKICWRTSKTEVTAAMEGNSANNCQKLQEYMQCQWSKSIGCPYLEKISRLHLSSLEGIINECQINLPPEALKEQMQINSTNTNSGSTWKPLLIIHGSLLLTYSALTSVFGS